MKYSNDNPPLKCMMTQSTCYRNTRVMEVKGILWHSTGVNQPVLRRYVQPSDDDPDKRTLLKLLGKNSNKNDWNHIEKDAGLNFWIGQLADKTVAAVQTMPFNYRPWGCYKGNNGSCNNGWIQFEICEDGLADSKYFNEIYKEACEMTAYLCKMFNIDPKGTVNYKGVKVPTILCHQDSYKLGLGSNHADIYHWFEKHGKTMVDVRNDVKKLLNEDKAAIKAGDLVKVESGSVYYSGKSVPSWVTKLNWYVHQVSGDRAVINKSEDGSYSIMSSINVKYLSLAYPEGVKYEVVTDLPQYTNAGFASEKKNSVGKFSPGTYYIYNKYPDGYNGMYNITEDKTGSTAGYWINPSENIVVEVKDPEPVVSEIYRVRITWEDSKSQKGAFKDLENAKACAQENASLGYKVFNSQGAVVFTPDIIENAPEDPKEESPKEEEKEVFSTKTKIVGYSEEEFSSEETLNEIRAYKKIWSTNPEFDKEIVKAFFKIAPLYWIDPSIAISQSILETGWFRYSGSAVKPEQHNYCGLGVTSNGVSGASFDSIEEGVHAQCQHLFAYGCKDDVPEGEVIVDPRFSLVSRGCCESWEELAGKWAVPGYDTSKYSSLSEAAKNSDSYGQNILKIFESITSLELTDEEIDEYLADSEGKESEGEENTGDPATPETPSDVIDEDDDNHHDAESQLVEEAVSSFRKLILSLISLFKSLFSKE